MATRRDFEFQDRLRISFSFVARERGEDGLFYFEGRNDSALLYIGDVFTELWRYIGRPEYEGPSYEQVSTVQAEVVGFHTLFEGPLDHDQSAVLFLKSESDLLACSEAKSGLLVGYLDIERPFNEEAKVLRPEFRQERGR